MKSNKIYGYAELTGYMVPDITKLQSNYYPFAVYETIAYKRKLTSEATVNSVEEEIKIVPQEYHLYRHLRTSAQLSPSYKNTIDKESLSITLGEISSESDSAAFNSKLFIHSNAFRFTSVVIPATTVTGVCEVYTQYAADEVNYGKATAVSSPRNNKVIRPWRRFNLNDSVNMTVDATLSQVTGSTRVDDIRYGDIRYGEEEEINVVTDHYESRYMPTQNHDDEYELKVAAPVIVLNNELPISLEDEVVVKYPTLTMRNHVANVSSATHTASINVALTFEMKYLTVEILRVTEQFSSTLIDPDKDIQSNISPESITSRIELI